MVISLAGEDDAFAWVAVDELRVIPKCGDVFHEGLDVLGHFGHTHRGFDVVLDAGGEEDGECEFESAGSAAFDFVVDVVEADGGEIHGVEEVAGEGEHGGVGGLLVGVGLFEGDVFEAADGFHGHEVGVGALPAAREGGSVEVDHELELGGVGENVLVVVDEGLAVAAEEIDFDAFDA